MAAANGDQQTVIGPDARFKGELEFEKGARLLGRFEGQVVTKGEFEVATGARLDGEVQAGSIRLDGEVHGNLHATEKVHLSASAKLEGDLHTARLEVADGAVFIGHCVVGRNGAAESPSRAPKPAEPVGVPGDGKAKSPEPVAAKK